jgi:hypothetical protein
LNNNERRALTESSLLEIQEAASTRTTVSASEQRRPFALAALVIMLVRLLPAGTVLAAEVAP